MSEPLRITWLADDPETPFPSTCHALDEPNGLLAAGGDLSPTRLLNAYRQGIFPWYAEGNPILWWSPAPRCVIYPGEVHLSRRTRRRFNSGAYRLTLNMAFDEVLRACSEPREGEPDTWITPEMETAYQLMHRLGHACSLEVWEGDFLAGGIYGLLLGSMFFGESMFSRRTDGSKIALLALCRLLTRSGIELLDCQVANPHLFSMGAQEISREAFERKLLELVDKPSSFTDIPRGALPVERW